MSSRPQSLAMRSNSASSSPGFETSSGMKMGALQRPRERLDVGSGLLVEVSDRQFGAQLAEGGRAAVGDGVLVGDAHHERFLVLENGTGDFQSHGSAA